MAATLAVADNGGLIRLANFHTVSSNASIDVSDPALGRFMGLLSRALDEGRCEKLMLASYHGDEPQLERVLGRPVELRGQAHLSLVWRYKTRDITKNLPIDEALALLAGLMGPGGFRNAHLHTPGEEVQLAFSKKGKGSVRIGKTSNGSDAADADGTVAPTAHNREKQRYLELSRPFLRELGVTDEQGRLVPAMSRKWKQINKFVEVLASALAASPLAEAREVNVVDFGSGKGYLTFAMHDYLRNSLGLQGQVTGVELREDMVRLGNTAAARLEQPGLRFEHGDVRTYTPAAIDVMIALHACDVATDYALHLGIRSDAAIIMCSPCCHKQIRPQMHTPATLKPMLQYGVHLGQEAEMVTDSLRALLLEACGYETKVFEFVSLEHTNKNKMILAVKRPEPVEPSALLEKIQGLSIGGYAISRVRSQITGGTFATASGGQIATSSGQQARSAQGQHAHGAGQAVTAHGSPP